jgi:hypothetical protein
MIGRSLRPAVCGASSLRGHLFVTPARHPRVVLKLTNLLESTRLACALIYREGLPWRDAFRLERALAGTPLWQRARDAAMDAERSSHSDDPSDALKYLAVDHFLRVAIRRAVRLGLHQTTPMRVLDLGSGAGIFAHVCRAWGHDAVGSDLPFDEMPASARTVYQLLPELL